MKIAHYTPNKLHRLFCDYLPDIEFLDNQCTKDCDFVYCASTSKLVEAFDVAMKYKKPIICWVWDIPYNWKEWRGPFYKGKDLDENRDPYVNQIINLLHHCDKILCGSKWTQKVLKDKYHIESIQLDWYIDTPAIDKILNLQNYTTVPPNTIVQMSRFAPHKRFELLLDAFKGSKDMTCFGRAYAPNNYFDWLKYTYSKYPKIKFRENIGQQEWVHTLQKSKLFVSSSVFEGWGMTPIEALYCKIPVILADIPVFKEFYGDSVIYFEKDNVQDLKEKVEYVLSNGYIQDSIVYRGWNIIKDCTPEKFSLRWLTTIKEGL